VTTSQTNPPSPRRRRGIRRAHHRRLAAAGRADDGDERLAGDGCREGLRECPPAEKERLVFLAEGSQAAVRADLGAHSFDLLQRERSRRLSADSGGQGFQRRLVRDPRR
jgi:hypothetical protein